MRSSLGWVSILALGLALGCGDDGGGSSADAGPPDAAPFLGVTVSVTASTGPVAAATVILNDADGALVATGLTDGDGAATFETVPEGGSLSALINTGVKPRLVTVYGVEAGDTLTLAEEAEPAPFEATLQFTLPAQGGATTYQVFSGCPPKVVTPAVLDNVVVNGDCVDNGTVSLLAVARDAGMAPVGYAFLVDEAIADGQTKDVTFPAWTAPEATQTISLSNVDATANTVAIGVAVIRGESTFLLMTQSQAPGGTTETLDVMPMAPSFYQRYGIIAGYNKEVDANFSRATQLIAVADGAVASQGIDLNAIRMPEVASLELTWPDGGPRMVVTRTEDAPTNNLAPSAVSGQVRFDARDWSYIAPPGTLSVQLPELPSGLGFTAGFPAPTNYVSQGSVRSDVYPDYPSYRNSPLSLTLSPGLELNGTSSISAGTLVP